MTTQKSTPGDRKPAAPPAGGRKAATPPPQARGRRPPAPPPGRGRRSQQPDRFGFYFIAFAVIGIFLFGALVWGLRSLNRANGAAIVPTATVPVEIVSGPPTIPSNETPLPGLSNLPTPTLAAPDALNSGPFAAASPITSVVTDVAHLPDSVHLPPQIPQPKMDVSDTAPDFGTIKAGAVVTQVVTLANSGGRELVIRELYSDCSCLTVQSDATRLPTGSRTNLTLTYDAKATASVHGPVDHSVAILTTDGQHPLQKLAVTVVLP